MGPCSTRRTGASSQSPQKPCPFAIRIIAFLTPGACGGCLPGKLLMQTRARDEFREDRGERRHDRTRRRGGRRAIYHNWLLFSRSFAATPRELVSFRLSVALIRFRGQLVPRNRLP